MTAKKHVPKFKRKSFVEYLEERGILQSLTERNIAALKEAGIIDQKIGRKENEIPCQIKINISI